MLLIALDAAAPILVQHGSDASAHAWPREPSRLTSRGLIRVRHRSRAHGGRRA
jgi:hypothetical protein